jgi:hypothetical protein
MLLASIMFFLFILLMIFVFVGAWVIKKDWLINFPED